MDQTLNDIAQHAVSTCRAVSEQPIADDTKLLLIHSAAGVYVSLQRSIWRAHSKLEKIESAQNRYDDLRPLPIRHVG